MNILEHIRERAVARLPLNAKAVPRRLTDYAYKHFPGGWFGALETAAERWPQIPTIRRYLESHTPNAFTPRGQGVSLRAARLAKGLSQAEFARLAGITQGHLSNMERGRATISPLVWEALGLTEGPPVRARTEDLAVAATVPRPHLIHTSARTHTTTPRS